MVWEHLVTLYNISLSSINGYRHTPTNTHANILVFKYQFFFWQEKVECYVEYVLRNSLHTIAECGSANGLEIVVPSQGRENMNLLNSVKHI